MVQLIIIIPLSVILCYKSYLYGTKKKQPNLTEGNSLYTTNYTTNSSSETTHDQYSNSLKNTIEKMEYTQMNCNNKKLSDITFH